MNFRKRKSQKQAYKKNSVCLFIWFLNVLVNYKVVTRTGPKTDRLTILRAATHETELGDHDFCLSQSHYTDTDPTSITHGNKREWKKNPTKFIILGKCQISIFLPSYLSVYASFLSTILFFLINLCFHSTFSSIQPFIRFFFILMSV